MINHVRAFTPSREDPERLDARTAGRSGVLTSAARALRATASSANRSHVLLIGPRGAGKSHVVEVALRRFHAEAELDEQVRVARLPEDAIGIASAADVLVEVIRSLDAPSDVHQAALAARRDGRQVDLESAIHRLLDGKAMVLVVENLDRVMVAIGEPGQHDLRAWVERTGEVMVLATAPLLFQAVQTRASPWFGSFEVIHLRPLTLHEASELVEHLAREFGDNRLAAFVRTARGQSRLAAIHHLAGGSPRIWTIFASCVDLEQLDRLVPAAEALLEELVPFYQQRLWALPATEQKVLDVLARTAPSATVTQIAEAAGVQRDTTASTLGRLAEAGWVRRRKAPDTDRRESWYELAEPLLRHHLQYRASRGDELRLIVELLQAWFDHGNPTDALTELEALITDRTDTLGPTHPDTLTSRASHAHSLVESGNHTDALTAYRGIVSDLDGASGQAAKSRASVLIAAASLVVRGSLLRTTGTQTLSQDPLHLLWLVGMEADARAYAALPVEIRSLLDPGQ